MRQLIVKQTDIYKRTVDGRYCFNVDWSDNDYLLAFAYDTLNEALKWWGVSDSMISGYPQGGIVKYSHFPNCEAIKK